MKESKTGLVEVYTGDGKGKTTAALGLALRACGQGLKSYMIQFMKGEIYYGELGAAKDLPNGCLTIIQMGRPDFVSKENPEPIDVELAQKALELAREIIEAAEHDILILDEVNVAMDFGLISTGDVLQLIDEKPPEMELILTGRYAPQAIIDRADLVTEMKEIKHPYMRGIPARVGIER
jgi:cob(I)alamin adenosyltransferase